MISEKTVELNLTTELVNYLFFTTGTRPYILAPSQVQEGKLGFDTSIGFPLTGRPMLIQYKRAEYRKRKNEYLYHLNATVKQDQLLRLYILDKMGWDVFYALPLFHMPADVIAKRRRLLIRTLFIRPRWMIPVGGIAAMKGPHEVRHNLTTGKTFLHSEEGLELSDTYKFDEFVNQLIQNTESRSEQSSDRMLDDFNSVFANAQSFEYDNIVLESQDKEDKDAFRGQSIMVME